MTFDQKFVQNLVLLGITALLTGLVVPYVLRVVDYRKTIQQKQREAELARQAKLIDAQAKLLDDLTSLLWRWRYISMKVTYYGSSGIEEQYEAAWREYDESIWEVLSAVRNEVSRSRHLVSEACYSALRSIYEDEMVRLDRELGGAREEMRPPRPRGAFHELNQRIYHEVTDRIDEILARVATEVGLSGAQRSTASAQLETADRQTSRPGSV
jgi:hypothetical protein